MGNTATVERKEIHVSILGSCVLRDAFTLSKNAADYRNTGKEFVIDRFVQSINPLSAISPTLPTELSESLVEESLAATTSNFYKRNFRLDVTKGWADYLAEVRSEYLLLDLSTARLAMRRCGDSYVTYELEMKVTSTLPPLSPESALATLCAGEQIGLYDLSDAEIRDVLRAYLDRILTLYPERRIIVVDIRHLYTYLDPTRGCITTAGAADDRRYRRDDRVISLAYEFTRQYLPNAHFVDALPLLVGNTEHVWGKCGLHYIDEIYLYLLRAIECITAETEACPFPARKGKPMRARRLSQREKTCIAREKEALASLYARFSRTVSERYTAAVSRTVEEAKNLLPITDCTTVGTYESNGVTLTVHPTEGFSVSGRATADTVFYLASKTKKPCGGWAPLPTSLSPGLYRFTVGTDAEAGCFCQLILSYANGEQKWYTVDAASTLRVLSPSPSLLLRVIVKKGTDADVHGRILLESLS